MIYTKAKRIPNTALLFIMIAPISIVYYSLYIFNPANAGNRLLYPFQLLGDGIAIVILATLWLTILLDLLQPEYNKREMIYNKDWIYKPLKTVDILIPVVNEPKEIIEHTDRKSTR